MMHWLLITIWWRQCDHDANDIDCCTYVNCITLIVSDYSLEGAAIYKTVWFNMSSHNTTYCNYCFAVFMMTTVKSDNQNS